MNRYKDFLEKYNRTRQRLEELELEYQDQKKGEIYLKRKNNLISYGKDIYRKMLNIGTSGNICHIQGKRSRPHVKNPNVMVQERFNLYFVNVSEEEVSALVKLHIKNVDHYIVKFIRPGMLIITS